LVNNILTEYVLGMDSGASKIEIAIVSINGELSKILVINRSGNPASIGIEKYCENLLYSLEKVLEEIEERKIKGIGIGLAGYLDGLWNKDIVSCIVRKIPLRSSKISIFEDIISAHVSIHVLGDGVIGILGTGSNFYGICGEKSWRVGGWGHLIDDRGSAYSVGTRALSYVVKALDGRIDMTRLVSYAFKHFKVSSVHKLVSKIYSSNDPKRLIASFAPYVFRAAREEDPWALKVLGEEIDEIVLAIETIYRKLGCTNVPLGLTGSLYKENKDFLKDKIEGDLEKIFMRKLEIQDPRIKQSCASALIHMKSSDLYTNSILKNLLNTCRDEETREI